MQRWNITPLFLLIKKSIEVGKMKSPEKVEILCYKLKYGIDLKLKPHNILWSMKLSKAPDRAQMNFACWAIARGVFSFWISSFLSFPITDETDWPGDSSSRFVRFFVYRKMSSWKSVSRPSSSLFCLHFCLQLYLNLFILCVVQILYLIGSNFLT